MTIAAWFLFGHAAKHTGKAEHHCDWPVGREIATNKLSGISSRENVPVVVINDMNIAQIW
jgi:hypothetical protein